jgi:hypothetical protein
LFAAVKERSLLQHLRDNNALPFRIIQELTARIRASRSKKSLRMRAPFTQKSVHAATGEHAWFADLDLDSQLMLNSHSTEGDKPSLPSHRARLFQKWLRPVINKVRILKYRLKHLMIFSKSGKQKAHRKTIKWAERDLQCQEQVARERHGVREYSEYQVAQTRLRIQRLRKKYLQKKIKRQMPADEYVGEWPWN